MPITYMTHPQHGATHAYDFGEIERLKKTGWVETKEPTAEELAALKRGNKAAALRAELAELETPAEVVPAAPKKRGPKAKTA